MTRVRRASSPWRSRRESQAITWTALTALSRAVDEALGRHITVNATGAVAAVLLDAGVPAEIMRGFALVSRAAGLVGHIHEEQSDPAMHALWMAGEEAVPYEDSREPEDG